MMYFQKQPLEVLYCKKVFLEILQNLQENNFARVSFLIKLQASACNFIKKKPLAQVFSREFYEISKNTFSYRTPLVAASVFQLSKQCSSFSFIILFTNLYSFRQSGIFL